MNLTDQQLVLLLLRDLNNLSDEERLSIKKSYSIHGRESFKRIVETNKIYPFAAHILCGLDCDSDYWNNIHENFIARNKSIKILLNSLFQKSKILGVRSLTLTENFASVLSSDSCIGCFSSGDVDLSASIDEKELIISSMESIGFIVFKRKKSANISDKQCLMFFNDELFGSGFWFNVVWTPVTRDYFYQEKYKKRLNSDRLFNTNLIKGTSIKVLSDTSLLYFCCLHIASGHYYTLSPGIRLFVDIDRLIRSKNIHWSDILSWENEDDAGIRISMTLYLCHKLLKTPIPDVFYNKLVSNKLSEILLKFLYDDVSKEINYKNSNLHRLLIELLSNHRNRYFLLINDLIKLLFSKV